MASTPPGGSKRKHPGDIIKRGFRKLKHSLLPSSNVGSSTATPSGAGPLSTGPPSAPGPSTTPQPTAPHSTIAGPQSQQNALPGVASPSGAKPSLSHELKQISDCVLSSALQTLELSTQTFPPLKSVVDNLLGCLDVIRASSSNNQEYKKLTSDLTDTVNDMKPYVEKLSLEDRNGSAARILKDIEKEIAQIKQQQDHSRIRQLMDRQQDRDSVIERYRRVEALFQRLRTDIHCRAWDNSEKHLAATLLQGMSPAHDALYNSGFSTTIRRRGCTERTREKIQSDIHDWINDPNGAKIYWLNGMAGTGKTTIAYSLCEWLKNNQQLGGSYFCSRASHSCSDVNSIIPTIAYQLAQYSPMVRTTLCQALQNDLSGSRLNAVKQFENLIQEPAKAAKDPTLEGVVVVIDALDECQDEYGVRLILGILLKLGKHLPLKFFVTSRPERGIRDSFQLPSTCTPTILRLHDIEQSFVEKDIKRYLEDEFNSLSPPPSEEQIMQLVKQSGKLFIYAATIVRYIQQSRGPVNPVDRLKAILTATHGEINDGASKKYEELDKLYNTILTTAFDPEGVEQHELDTMRRILWTVVCAKEPMTVSTLSTFLSTTKSQVESALQPLYSVLHVSESSSLVSVLHASFPDYLLEQSRSGNVSCNRANQSMLLAAQCFDVMKGQLRFNICNLESSFVSDDNVPNLKQRIQASVSPALFYACRYWGDHLLEAANTDRPTLCNLLVDFLDNRLLFWMEVMNLKKCLVDGISLLNQAERWLHSEADTVYVRTQTADARDFMTRFAASPCAHVTPHIYISALPSCAKISSVYKCYWGRMKGLIKLEGTIMSRWADVAQAMWRTGSGVYSISISTDGMRIAFCGADKTIRVWDAHTGETVAGPFQGHTSSVYSVAFSPDGTRIVSGSYDETIRVWDAHTGETVAGPFQGHTSSVMAVAFSPDGTRIVSGSRDSTIRVWDARTGETVAGPFQGHTLSVSSVAFSPDGTRILSGCYDETIRVWDACTGETVVGPFQGHTELVSSVAFSPDGTRIVSGSDDNTIRVWDARTGETVAGPFQGHIESVSSVAFSPDDTRILSGCYDETIRVWDAHTGETVAGPFQGHTESAMAVAFSPDCTHAAFAGQDTLRVQDACASGHNFREQRLPPQDEGLVSGQAKYTQKFYIKENGWIMFDDLPVVWLPANLCALHPLPATTLVIRSAGTLVIDYSQMVLGEKWSECYDFH